MGMTDAIDLTTEQRNTLSDLLRRFLPGVAVWAYGSRVKWTARPNSDLDLVAFATPAQLPQVAEFKDALAESNLPFPVDLHVWDEVPERFREIIRKEYVVVQEAKQPEGKPSVPIAWQRHEVSKLLADGKLVVGDGYRAKNTELSRTGLPFARAGNINNGFQFAEADHFPSDARSTVGNKLSQPGDVVFTSKGTVGRFAFVREDTPQFVYSPQLCFWRSLDQSLIQSRFLYYWMHGSEFFTQFKGVAGQTDMAEYVSLTDQRRMHITLPSDPEQRAIAHILGTLDDKIELNRKMNETLETMARALFKSWFVDFDPVCTKAEGRDTGLPKLLADLFPDSFEDSELGEIPKGWEVVNLNDVADINYGQNLPQTELLGCGIPVFGAAGVIGYYSEAMFNDPIVLVTSRGSGSGAVHETHGPSFVTNNSFSVIPKDGWFSRHYLKASLLNGDISSLVTGSAQPQLTITNFSYLKLIRPAESVVHKFHSFADSIWQKKNANQNESRILADLRDTLLPKLISGELRIDAAERFIKESTI